MVQVGWEDAYLHTDNLEANGHLQPALQTTIGFVVKDDRDAADHPSIWIAMTDNKGPVEDETDARFRDVMRIPAGMIDHVMLLVRRGPDATAVTA